MLVSRNYIDLDLNFIINPVTGDISKNTGNKAVIGSVKNLVQTRFYEKKFHPEVGCNAAGLLFEPLTALTANAIKREIENVLGNYEPRVSVRYISVTVNNDENGYDVVLEFFINNQVDPVAIATFLERIS